MVLMKKYIKFNFNLDGELSLNKAMEELLLMKKKHILATSFLRWMLTWIMKNIKCYIMTELTFMKGLMLIRQQSVIFAINDIF